MMKNHCSQIARPLLSEAKTPFSHLLHSLPHATDIPPPCQRSKTCHRRACVGCSHPWTCAWQESCEAALAFRARDWATRWWFSKPSKINGDSLYSKGIECKTSKWKSDPGKLYFGAFSQDNLMILFGCRVVWLTQASASCVRKVKTCPSRKASKDYSTNLESSTRGPQKNLLIACMYSNSSKRQHFCNLVQCLLAVGLWEKLQNKEHTLLQHTMFFDAFWVT